MARRSYGDDVKARVKRLFEALLAYVNNEYEDSDRISIEFNWQGETQLVIRAKRRYLEELTAKDKYEGKLTPAHIREALNCLEDFLGILEDNRTTTQGSEDWHFTLKLWQKAKEANLRQFDIEWDNKRPPKSKAAARKTQTDNSSATTSVANKPPENVSDQGIEPGRFIGREAELAKLHELLQQNGQVAITAVAGMAGVGKTELAIQYAKQHLADYPGGTCRLLGQEPQMGLQLIEFFEDEFNLIAPDDRELASRVQFCWKRWQRDGEVLVVLDDVKRYSEIEDYLPPRNSRFKVLMTTQLNFAWNSSVQQLSLELLHLDAAIKLLESFIGKNRISLESEIAAELCEWLGRLPLALTLVGSYLQEFDKLSLQTMLARLKSQKLQHASFDPQCNPTLDKKSSRALAAAFELSWQRLGEMDENAQIIGCYLSLYALAPIPLSLEADESDGEEVEVWETAIKNLLKLHLLDEIGVESYQLHSLIREFFREKLLQLENAEDLKRGFAAQMVEVAKRIEYQITREDIVNLTPWIPHLEELANLDSDLIQYLSDEDLITPFNRLGWLYEGQSFYQPAERWKKICKEVAENRLGTEHPDFAISLNNLALLYYSQGRYEEAEPLFLQALEMFQQMLGRNHPHTTTVRQNFTLFLLQAITEERADLEALIANPLVREILAEIFAEIEPSPDTKNE